MNVAKEMNTLLEEAKKHGITIEGVFVVNDDAWKSAPQWLQSRLINFGFYLVDPEELSGQGSGNTAKPFRIEHKPK